MNPEPKAFRQTVGQFATGVTVIATAVRQDDHEDVHAMTANSFTSLSLDPMLVLFCVGKKTRMANYIESASGFSVNILRQEQQQLSTFFAGGWKQNSPPPFRFVPFQGGPRLEGALAALGCELHQIVEGGDHWIVTGEVVALHRGIEPHHPLLFFGGNYQGINPADKVPAPMLDEMTTPVCVFYDPWEE